MPRAAMPLPLHMFQSVTALTFTPRAGGTEDPQRETGTAGARPLARRSRRTSSVLLPVFLPPSLARLLLPQTVVFSSTDNVAVQLK